MTYEDLNSVYIFLTKVMKFIWYGLFGYLLVAWLAPSMSFTASVSEIGGFVFIDVPNMLFEYFYVISEHYEKMYVYGDSSTTWAKLTQGFFALISLGSVLLYYILLLFIFLASIGYEDTGSNPALENEMDWLMGIGTTEDHKQAQIQARAIVAELNRNK